MVSPIRSLVHGATGKKEFQACAILEFKSPGMVRSMITVIGDNLHTASDQSYNSAFGSRP